MDAKLDQLSASGGLDPALLLTLAKAHTSVKDTDYTKEEVKDVMAHLYFKVSHLLHISCTQVHCRLIAMTVHHGVDAQQELLSASFAVLRVYQPCFILSLLRVLLMRSHTAATDCDSFVSAKGGSATAVHGLHIS